MWTVGLTVEVKLRFQNISGEVHAGGPETNVFQGSWGDMFFFSRTYQAELDFYESTSLKSQLSL